MLFTGLESAYAHEFDSLGLLIRHKENKVSVISAPPLAVFVTNDKGEKLSFDSNSDGNISFEEIRQFEDEIEKQVEQRVVFRDQQGQAAKLISFKLLEKGYENLLKISVSDNKETVISEKAERVQRVEKESESAVFIQLSLKYEWENIPQSIRLNYGLLTAEKKHVLVRNQNSRESQVLVLEPENSTMTVFPINSDSSANTNAIWVLGIEHVLEGLDHLLFIFTLVLVCKSSMSLVAPLSAFTLTHSLALVLVALGVQINVPSWIIEASIAMTIVIMALFELLGWKPRRLFLMTAAMGLIHGFGLGQALSDSIGGVEGWAIALAKVTLGIELAQLAVALIFFVILSYASKLLKVKTKRLDRYISGIVIFAGLFWTLERVFS
jgi:hypothetical protein